MSEKVSFKVFSTTSSTLRGRTISSEELEFKRPITDFQNVKSPDELVDTIVEEFSYLSRGAPTTNLSNLMHYFKSKKLKVFLFTKYYDTDTVQLINDNADNLSNFKMHLNHQKMFTVKLVFLRRSGMKILTSSEINDKLLGHAKSFESFFSKIEITDSSINNHLSMLPTNFIDSMKPFFDSLTGDINDVAVTVESFSDSLGTLIDDKLQNVFQMITSLQEKMDGLEFPGPPDWNPSSNQEKQQPSLSIPKVVHKNIICDKCDQLVIGVRYKCIDCDNFDLCQSCERSDPVILSHSPDHQMIKMPQPIMRPDNSSINNCVLKDVHYYFQVPESNTDESTADTMATENDDDENEDDDVIVTFEEFKLLYLRSDNERVLLIGIENETPVQSATLKIDTFDIENFIEYEFNFMNKEKHIVIDLFDVLVGRTLNVAEISNLTIEFDNGQKYKLVGESQCILDQQELFGKFVELNEDEKSLNDMDNTATTASTTSTIDDVIPSYNDTPENTPKLGSPFELLYYNEVNSLGDVNLVIKTNSNYELATMYGLDGAHLTSKEFKFINGVASVIILSGFKYIYIHIDETNELFKLEMDNDHEGSFEISSDDIFSTKSNENSFIVPTPMGDSGTEDDDFGVMVEYNNSDGDSFDLTDYEILSSADDYE